MNTQRETALITGASSGIGAAFAQLLAADRTNLVLVARRRGRLDQLAGRLQSKFGVEATVIPCDLTSPAQRQQLVQQLDDQRLSVDVLVNNAGFGLAGRFSDYSLDDQIQMIELNVVALTDLARRFLPGMLDRQRGAVLNVASTAAFQPGPNMAVYFATKAFVLSLSEALSEETRGTGVTVTALCPGPTATEFGDRSHMNETLLFRLGTMPARNVARCGYRAMRRGKAVVIPGLANRLVAFMVRVTPRWLVRRIAACLVRRP